MAINRNFSESLENDLRRLTVEIGERRPQAEKEELPERQLVKKSLEVFWPPEMTQSVAPAAEKTEEMVSAKPGFLPGYLKAEPDSEEAVNRKIENLVAIAFDKGVAEAWQAASRENPFVVDAFHDALIDKLMPELKKRGVIKESR